jgi:hypothetical protein
MTDHVPGDIESGKRLPLACRVTDSVLADTIETGRENLGHNLNRMSLGNRENLDRRRIPVYCFRRPADSVPHPGGSLANLHMVHGREFTGHDRPRQRAGAVRARLQMRQAGRVTAAGLFEGLGKSDQPVSP